MFDIRKLKEIRKKQGITQNELAKRSEVSQSLITRIENGEVDPCYSKVQRIINALEQTSKGKIEEIMTKKIIAVKPSDEIKKAIRIMRKRGISQLPVIENDKIIGTVSETGASTIIQHRSLKYVREIIEPSLPTMDKNSSIQSCNELLKHCPAIIITNNGKLCGIVTKANLLKLI
ncbi:MAG: CBS domain-containing protein [Candidatus Aenigmatarchaeota archaeon]